jgi:hypothetical protein
MCVTIGAIIPVILLLLSVLYRPIHTHTDMCVCVNIITITYNQYVPVEITGFGSHIKPSTDPVSYKAYKRKDYKIQLTSGDEISTLTYTMS